MDYSYITFAETQESYQVFVISILGNISKWEVLLIAPEIWYVYVFILLIGIVFILLNKTKVLLLLMVLVHSFLLYIGIIIILHNLNIDILFI